jgi:hypothetical protein
MTGTKTTKEKLKSWPKNRNRIRKALFCQCPDCPTCLPAKKETVAEKKSRAVACPVSPEFPETGQPAEDTYCLMGMSFKNIDREEVCLCPTCDVQKDLDLGHIYYCMRGSVKAQRWDEEPGRSSRGRL